jgi:hypothetical protein
MALRLADPSSPDALAGVLVVARTIIERDGREFELPDGHTLDIFTGSTTYASLDAPLVGGSLYTVREMEERGGDLVVHLGDSMGESGPGSWGNVVAEPTGYPFPD